jgi:sigma-B regulation protein RsbU (phosphoserine phosphatase)
VGGDFYDVFDLPGRRLGLVVADVADKGIPAALFMALTRALVRAAALTLQNPTEALAHVNDLLIPDTQHGMFVTALYGVVSLDTGRLVYANAGHLPPLVWRHQTQSLERPGKGGLALGLMEGAKSPEQIIDLLPGDCVILYTDGVTDALSASGEFYGDQRLQDCIRSAEFTSAQSLLGVIDASLSAFVGETPPADDLTLTVLGRRLQYGSQESGVEHG